MGLDVTKTTGTEYSPVFHQILETMIAGGTLATNRVPSNIKELKEGLLLVESANTSGLYQFIKAAKSVKTQAAATKMFFDNTFEQLYNVGDFVIVNGKTTAATITRIDSTSSVNTLIVATARALGTLATASVLVEAAAAGATALKYDPSCILKKTVKVREDDLTTINNVLGAIVLRANINESILPQPVTTRMKTKMTVRYIWD